MFKSDKRACSQLLNLVVLLMLSVAGNNADVLKFFDLKFRTMTD